MDRKIIKFVIIIFLLLFILNHFFSMINSKEKETIDKIETKAEPKDAAINVDFRDGTLSLFLKIKFQLNGHFSVKLNILDLFFIQMTNFRYLFTVSINKFKNNEILVTLFFKIKIKCHP